MKAEVRKKEEQRMSRAGAVIEHPLFRERLSELEELEKDRIYCRHGFGHLLDAARLAYIFALERGYDIDKDLIYATALLHDIGRSTQYKKGIPHAEAGVEPALRVLLDCGFTETEAAMALLAIASHSDESRTCVEAVQALLPGQEYDSEIAGRLQEIIYDGDKLSRDCFRCKAEKECKWDENMKKKTISW